MLRRVAQGERRGSVVQCRAPIERGKTMGRKRTIFAVVLWLAFAGGAAADTLELKDGRVLQGRYLGGTQAVLRFEIKGEVQTFSVMDAVAVTFTGTSGAADAPAPSAPAAAPPPPASPAPAPDA